MKRPGRGWWIAAAALGIVVLFCVGIIWAGAMKDGDGNPFIENTTAVLVGLFSLIGGLGSALIAKLTPPLKVITENVQNDHVKPDGTPLNLRDDLDDKHDTTLAVLEVFRREVRRDIGGLRQENRDDRKASADRFDSIEDRLSAATNRIHTIEQRRKP